MSEQSPLPTSSFSRRSFLANAGRGLVAAAVAGEVLSNASPVRAAESDLPGKPIKVPSMHAKTEQESGLVPEPLPPDKRVGFAVVGLGSLSLNQIIPALAKCKKARLAAVVSGSREKALRVAREHGLSEKAVYDYKTYDELKDNKEVDVIYIVLPNGMHAEYTVRGAKAGKHILCEKPMANTVEECQEMITACQQAGRKLMIAYRIQYEPHHAIAKKWLREKKFGVSKLIEAVNTQNQGDPGQWRQNKKLAGGGSLPDIGLYCLNTVRYLIGEEPTEVSAMIYSTPNDPRFKEVEENVTWQMRFPGGILANCATAYGVHQSRRYRVHAETGWFGLDPAFSYENLAMETSHAEGMIEYREKVGIMPKDQFALEMDHMAECVLDDKRPYTPGEEGLQDQRIMEAIYAAAEGGKPVKIATPGAGAGKLDLFRGEVPKMEG